MGQDMIIRQATLADLPALATLYRAFFLEDGIATEPDAVQGNLALMMDDPRATILVAEANGQIEGFSAGSLTFGIEFGWTAELEDLFVTPPHRGRGWARKLAEAVVAWAKANGACETFLVITPQAETEQSLTTFYERLGFRDSGRITMFRTHSQVSN